MLAVETMQPLHALSVHEEMELLGVMVIVYGLMNNVFQKVKFKITLFKLQDQISYWPCARITQNLNGRLPDVFCNFEVEALIKKS